MVNKEKSADDSKLASLIDLALSDDERNDASPPMTTLRRELAMSVADLVDQGLLTSEQLDQVTAANGSNVPIVGDVLFSAEPSIDVLRAIKVRWKAMRLRQGSNESGVAATALYYLSLLVARIRCGTQITSLRDVDLRKGLTWLVVQPWIEDPLTKFVDDLQLVDPWPDISQVD